jgi:4-aminobutyrate aminotransferase
VIEPLLPQINAMGQRLLDGSRKLQEKYAVIGDVRGRGLMIGVEFVKDRKTREPYPELIDRVTERAFARGLLLLGCGKSTFRFAPPLVLDQYDVDTGLAILDECLKEED